MRYGIDRIFYNDNAQFPISTFLINLLGSFVAGAIFALGENQNISHGLQVALLVGFCGGFTTFSAYTLQTFGMLEQGRVLPALLYLMASPALGLLMAFAGVFTVRRFV